MTKRIDDLIPDHYIITNSMGQYFIPSRIFEGLWLLAKSKGWKPSKNKTPENFSIYGSTDGNIHLALATRFSYSKENLKDFAEIIDNYHSELSLTSERSLYDPSDFNSFENTEGKTLPMSTELISSIINEVLDKRIKFISNKLASLGSQLTSAYSEIENKSFIVLDKGRYRKSAVTFKNGLHRPMKFQTGLIESNEDLEWFNSILEAGNATIDLVQMYLRFKVPNDLNLTEPTNESLDVIDYNGGRAYVFPIL
ncbi:hypothetical protein [Reichenbachiella versicolor]|uniref:hypothetical protein n=1 Tax=Reichenbachiella versicolor TaxID=1821036 RepID=UPI000D6DC66B|nr:hypothetical protein [Reichenbachiella versicolor]